ncbi:methyl-accepting chemotaxis protein [Marinobacter qingdaonensis]|uniref:Methyl-accepting chemotaxis protein n=1 Tax=Marinobacter qingdaonensis TaxID=3108486 RepID=A0ABU5NZF0_9GAMM|nr:methyl-accepting chemotaxis protein [Marinobacter sp. ASW11-75]MEA1081188.1 methyl-accepting chemotaxis protein [Marinobacter sp. ASW11-75]
MALSWKQKFLLLIAATFLGLAIATLASLSGLAKVSEAYEARGQAQGYGAASLNLLNDWLAVERLSEDLTPDTADRFRVMLDSLLAQANELTELAAQLPTEAETEAGAGEVRDRVQDYTELRREWLATSQTLGLTHNDGLKATLSGYVDNDLRAISISIFNDDINTIASNYRDYLDSFDPSYAEQTRDAIARMQAVVTDMEWQDIDIGQAVQGLATAFTEAETVVGDLAALEAQLEIRGSALRTLIDDQIDALNTGLIRTTSEQAVQARTASTWLILATSVVVLLVLVLTLTGASRTLVKRLNEVVRLLSQVASGDLSQRLAPGRNPKDEFNQLGNATNQMLDDVSAVIGQVVEGNKTLASLQEELDALIGHMDRKGEQVAEETEQTATAVQEIAHTAVEIAQHTQSVNTATQRANGAAQSGAQVVKRSSDSMSALAERIQRTHDQIGQLSKTGEQVNSIVGVINSLAEQTNLLALNAAIEAARAGEAGRGFSVVADEVRSLAEKTVSATDGIADIVNSLNRETSAITTMMQEGLKSASEGEQSANEAAEAIDQITGSIDQLAGDMNQVVNSVEGISTTTEEIAQKVEQIHGHTQETTDMRQRLTAHIERLSSQTASLTSASQRFRL